MAKDCQVWFKKNRDCSGLGNFKSAASTATMKELDAGLLDPAEVLRRLSSPLVRASQVRLREARPKF